MRVESHTRTPLERDRLSILLAVTLTGATLFRFVELPTYAWSVRRIFGSPLGFTIGGDWLLPLLITGLIAAGTFSLVRAHPDSRTRERPTPFSLITPSVAGLFASMLLIRALSWTLWLGSLLLTGLMIGVLLHLTYRVYSTASPTYTSARSLLNLTDYLLAFGLFAMILNAQERALVTGPAVLLVSGLLALDLLSAGGNDTGSVLLFGGVIALFAGQLAWVLAYWPISVWGGATLLTLALYLGTGVSYQYLLERLTPRILVEFAGLACLVFILVLAIHP